jgi:hypothetical protein
MSPAAADAKRAEIVRLYIDENLSAPSMHVRSALLSRQSLITCSAPALLYEHRANHTPFRKSGPSAPRMHVA